MEAMPSVTLDVLPADEGDCLLLICHTAEGDRHVLIDAGTPATAARLKPRLAKLVPRHLELLGLPDAKIGIGDIWFNGRRHLQSPGIAARGFRDAEGLSDILAGTSNVAGGEGLPWNEAFGGGAVVRPDDDRRTGETTGELPVVAFPWGLTLTLLSPTPKRLQRLLAGWDRYLAELHAGEPSPQTRQVPSPAARSATLEEIAARPTANDAAPPNGSSIAFLAEFGGRSILFAADAFPTVLYPALLRLARARAGLDPGTDATEVPPLHVDVFKLPHHGSKANVALDLFGVVRADHYIVSTSGSRFLHPDEEGIARVLTCGRRSPGLPITLWFNYASETTRRWLDPDFKKAHGFETAGASEGRDGATLVLPARSSRA